jgi:hypothetical protein
LFGGFAAALFGEEKGGDASTGAGSFGGGGEAEPVRVGAGWGGARELVKEEAAFAVGSGE